MTINADSYGTTAGVAALARTWTVDGEFQNADACADIEGTNPTLDTVENWINQVIGVRWYAWGFVAKASGGVLWTVGNRHQLF